MTSAFSHIAIPIDLKIAGRKNSIPWRLLFLAMFLSVALLCSRYSRLFLSKSKVVFFFSFVSMVSHIFLDALTNGGLGVAVFWTFDSERYFLPWRVIEVSPISVSRFLVNGVVRF